MKPGVFNLTIYCGTTADRASQEFTYKVGGVVVNLTGFTLRSMGCTDKGEVLFHATTENGQIGVEPLTGKFWLNLSSADTTQMWRRGFAPYSSSDGAVLYNAGSWDVELVSVDGRVVRLLHGRLLLSPEVPR